MDDAATSNVDAFANDFIDEIVRLLEQEKWEDASERTLAAHSRYLSLPASYHRFGGLVMGSACYKDSATLRFFEVVIQVAGDQAVTYKDAGLRTPLHMVLMYLDRPDICRLLVTTAPRTVDMHDIAGLRPVDVLTQKIHMKEERLRYLKKATFGRDVDSRKQDEINTELRMLENCWECARICCLVHGRALESNPNLPLVHSCCLDRRRVPLSLLHFAVKRNPDQLKVQDEVNSETPLHILARQFSPDTDDVDEESDLLKKVCESLPAAACMLNVDYKYPLDLAIESGRKWRSGCRCLTKACPSAVLHQKQSDDCGNEDRSIFQILMSALRNEEFVHDVIFQILRSRPQILFEDGEISSGTSL